MLQLSRVGLRIYIKGVLGQRRALVWVEAPTAEIRVSSKAHTLEQLMTLKETTRTALRQYAGGVDAKTFNDVAKLINNG